MAGATGAAVAGLITALSAGTSYATSEKTNNQRISAINSASDVQQELSKKSEKAVKDSADKYDPQDRQAAQDNLATEVERSLGDTLTKAQKPNDVNSGRVSDEFLTENAKSTTDRLTRGANLAKMMARMRAPNDLRFEEGLSNANTASRVRGLFGDQRSAVSAGGNAASAVSPDGGAMLASDLLRTAGSAYGNTARIRSSGIYGTGGNPYGS